MTTSHSMEQGKSYTVSDASEAEAQLRAILENMGWSTEDIENYVDDADIDPASGILYAEGTEECPIDVQWCWPVETVLTVDEAFDRLVFAAENFKQALSDLNDVFNSKETGIDEFIELVDSVLYDLDNEISQLEGSDD